MKHPIKKLIACIALAAALTAALALVYSNCVFYTEEAAFNREIGMKADAVKEMFTNLLASRINAALELNNKNASAEMMAVTLRPVVEAKGDDAIRAFKYGCVVKLEDRSVRAPEGDGYYRDITPDSFFDADGARLAEGAFTLVTGDGDGSASSIASFYRIAGDYYYVDMMPGVNAQTSDMNVEIDGIIRQVEKAYGGYIVTLASYDDGGELLWGIAYPPKAFESYVDPAALGIDMTAPADEPRRVLIDGEEYVCVVTEDLQESGFMNDVRIAFLMPAPTRSLSQRGSIAVMAAFSFLLLAALTTWIIAAINVLRRPTVNASDARRYSPKRARRAVLCFGVVSAAAVVGVAMFLLSLASLINMADDSGEVQKALESMQEQDNEWIENQATLGTEMYVRYAERVAEALSLYPELKTKETLDGIGGVIGAEYLMLFDKRGNQAMSNSRYVNLTLGRDETSSTYDFRRLLLGVPSIAHDPCVDEQTGLNCQLIGASVGNTETGYGALIVAVPDEDEGNTRALADIISALSTSDNLYFAVDEETGEIKRAIDEDLLGKNAISLGLKESSYKDGSIDFYTFNNEHWYGRSEEFNDLAYFFLTRESAVFRGLFPRALLCGAAYLVAYALMGLALLAGYGQKEIDALGGQKVEQVGHLPPNASSLSDEPAGLVAWWRYKSPGWKAWFVAQALLGVGLTASFLAMQLHLDLTGSSFLLNHIFAGQWHAGFNLFAYTRIAILILGVALAVMALKLLIGITRSAMDTRGKTVSLIVFNLIQYVVVVLAIYYAFQYVGIDITVPLTSLAALSFAITLLAKDAISDVLAGIGTAFSSSYHIGDYVEVAGFRGRVSNITMSTTTLVNNDGNIKVISNRDVRNVLNMSRGGSRYTVNITIGYDQPLDQVEALLAEELPKIGDRIHEIDGTPTYLGMTGIGSGGMTLTIAANCRERDYAAVRNKLNRELRRLFRENSITIK